MRTGVDIAPTASTTHQPPSETHPSPSATPQPPPMNGGQGLTLLLQRLASTGSPCPNDGPARQSCATATSVCTGIPKAQRCNDNLMSPVACFSISSNAVSASAFPNGVPDKSKCTMVN